MYGMLCCYYFIIIIIYSNDDIQPSTLITDQSPSGLLLEKIGLNLNTL